MPRHDLHTPQKCAQRGRQRWTSDGYRSSARATELFRDLAVAHVDGRFGRKLAKLPRIDVLVLDDFAMAPLKDSERRDSPELSDDRYQRRSNDRNLPVESGQIHSLNANSSG
jgi:hypothetical protein